MTMEHRGSRRRREREERKANKGINQPYQGERTADLAAMMGCGEAHQAQAGLYMLSAGSFTPIACPHCGEIPELGPIQQNIDPDLPGYVKE